MGWKEAPDNVRELIVAPKQMGSSTNLVAMCYDITVRIVRIIYCHRLPRIGLS